MVFLLEEPFKDLLTFPWNVDELLPFPTVSIYSLLLNPQEQRSKFPLYTEPSVLVSFALSFGGVRRVLGLLGLLEPENSPLIGKD